MIQVAKELFADRGFSRTTMEEIAEKANFGVATIYNYFGSKEGIFAALAREDQSLIKAQAEEQLLKLPKDPVDAVFSLIQVYDRMYDHMSYSAIQEFIVRSKRGGPLQEVSSWVLNWQAEQVRQALKHGQKQGVLSKKLDSKLAAFIIIDLQVRHNQRATSTPDDPEDLKVVKKSIALILEGWRIK